MFTLLPIALLGPRTHSYQPRLPHSTFSPWPLESMFSLLPIALLIPETLSYQRRLHPPSIQFAAPQGPRPPFVAVHRWARINHNNNNGQRMTINQREDWADGLLDLCDPLWEVIKKIYLGMGSGKTSNTTLRILSIRGHSGLN